MTKAEIKARLETLRDAQKAQIQSAKEQVKYLQEEVVQKVDLDDEIAALEASVADLDSIIDGIEGEAKADAKPEAKTAEADSIEKTAVEGEIGKPGEITQTAPEVQSVDAKTVDAQEAKAEAAANEDVAKTGKRK